MTWKFSFIYLPPGEERPQTETEKFLVANFLGLEVITCVLGHFVSQDKQSAIEEFNSRYYARACNAWAIDATPLSKPPSRAKIE